MTIIIVTLQGYAVIQIETIVTINFCFIRLCTTCMTYVDTNSVIFVSKLF